MTAGGDAVLASFGNVKGHLAAGGYAFLASWADVDNMVVEGPAGVGVWAVGHIEGLASSRVTSTQGEVNILALGNVSARVEAAADATILSEGDVNASLDAGKDAFVLAYGDVTGNYSADRDASVITYGNFNAGLHAGRDIGRRPFGGNALPGVWARGNISGAITADRNIGYEDQQAIQDDYDYVIFSYGSIDAAILAYNTANTSNGGYVGSIGALGAIGGTIIGQRAVSLVQSGDAVTAFIQAPNLPTVIEFDSTMATNYPLPAVPDSILNEVLADLQAARDQLFADKDQYEQILDAGRSDFGATRQQALSDLAQAVAQWSADNSETKADAESSLKDDQDAAIKGLRQKQQEEHEFMLAAVDGKVDASKKEAAANHNRDQAQRKAARQAKEAADRVKAVNNTIAQTDNELAQARVAVQQNSDWKMTEHIMAFQETPKNVVETWNWGGFFDGLGTGFKALGNSGVDTVVGFVSLGGLLFDAEPLHVFGGEDELGYDASTPFNMSLTPGFGQSSRGGDMVIPFAALFSRLWFFRPAFLFGVTRQVDAFRESHQLDREFSRWHDLIALPDFRVHGDVHAHRRGSHVLRQVVVRQFFIDRFFTVNRSQRRFHHGIGVISQNRRGEGEQRRLGVAQRLHFAAQHLGQSLEGFFNRPALAIQKSHFSRIGDFDRQVGQDVNLSVTILCGRIQLDGDPPDSQRLFTLGQLGRLLENNTRFDASDAFPATDEFPGECRSVLANDKVGRLLDNSKQKLGRAEVPVGDCHRLGPDPFQKLRQKRTFLSMPVFTREQFRNQIPLRVQKRQGLAGQRAFPRDAQFRQPMLSRRQMIPVQILHVIARQKFAACSRHGIDDLSRVLARFPDHRRRKTGFQTVQLAIKCGRRNRQLLLGRQVPGMDRRVRPRRHAHHQGHHLRKQQFFLVLSLRSVGENLIQAIRRHKILERRSNHHCRWTFFHKTIKHSVGPHPCRLHKV